MSRLTARGIGKTYGGKQVLQGIDLELESGKIYGLIGRNGAGKTTLLSVLTAQNPATAGSVTFDGEPVWENPRALEHLCFAREYDGTADSGGGRSRSPVSGLRDSGLDDGAECGSAVLKEGEQCGALCENSLSFSTGTGARSWLSWPAPGRSASWRTASYTQP